MERRADSELTGGSGMWRYRSWLNTQLQHGIKRARDNPHDHRTRPQRRLAKNPVAGNPRDFRGERIAAKWSVHQQRRSGLSVVIFSVTPGEFFTMSPITLMHGGLRKTSIGHSELNAQTGYSEGELGWVPRVEVRQSGNNLVIHAELPGVNENEVRVEVTDEGLVIEGERKREQESDERGWHRSEISYGQFYRLIPLPENAKLDQARANFRNGVLEVTVPVPEVENRRRQIPIETAGQTQGAKQISDSSEGRSRGASAGTR